MTALVPVLLSLVLTVQSSIISSRRSNPLCQGGREDIYLPNEIPQTLESQGYSSQEFTEDCKQHYDIFVDRSHDDLAQWRVKIEIDSLNLPCDSGYLQIIEDGVQPQNLQICNEKRPDESGFVFSHAHMISVKIVTTKCSDSMGCQGQGVRVKVSGEYVCGGQYTGETGSITSPLYPQNYVNSMACIYDIVAPKHSRLLLTCSEFKLSKRGRDRTKFQNLETFTTYYGSDLRGRTLKTKRNVVTFYFHSNNVDLRDQEAGYRFNCTYSTTT